MWFSAVRRRVGSCCSFPATIEQLPRRECRGPQSAEEVSLTGVWVERAFVLAHSAHSTITSGQLLPVMLVFVQKQTHGQLLPVMSLVFVQKQTHDGHQCEAGAFSRGR